VLKGARQLLGERRDRWTKYKFAVAEDGCPLNDGTDTRAVSWCAIGALEHVAGETILRGNLIEAIMVLDHWVPGPYGVAQFNDHATTTYEMVLRLYDQAIGSFA
jgi:hypothetical protein